MLNDSGAFAGNMLEITRGGLTMQRYADRFLGVKDHMLPDLKILGRDSTETPQQQDDEVAQSGQVFVHTSFLTKSER